MIRLQSYIAGAWFQGTGTPVPLFNPATDEQVAETDATGVDFAAAVKHAREVGVPALQGMGFQARAELAGKLSKVLREHRDELLDISRINGGNTRGDAKFDVDGAIGTLAFYGGLKGQLPEGNVLPDGDGMQLGRTARFWGQHIRTPKRGVAVHINAFNFPAWGLGEKLAQAVVAGVPVITKPGTPSAWLAWRVAQLIVESGVLPEGAFQFVAGSAGDLLDHLGPQDMLSFTGSAWTGAKLKGHPNLIQRNVRTTLEADSINAAILSPDAGSDSEAFQQMVRNVVIDITQKAGQKCTAVRRILVPGDHREEFIEAVVDSLSRIKMGDPADGDVRCGPVASKAAHKDVLEGIQKFGELGRFACGGAEAPTDKGCFVNPTLVDIQDADAELLHSTEVFGPMASVIGYDGSAGQAVEIAARAQGCLVTSVYGNDRKWQEEVVIGLAPWHGRVWTCTDKVADLSFPPGMVMPQMIHGGPGRAGGGEELGGAYGFEFYTQRTAIQGDKAVVARAFGASGD